MSPDFTYSQSYLSLLSASGCMAGIICCASPTLWGIMKRACQGRHLHFRCHVKALQVCISGETFPPPEDEVNDGAFVALFDFHRSYENELPLNQGQRIWIHRKSGQGWLLAQNCWSTDEIGLIPETFVRLAERREWPEMWRHAPLLPRSGPRVQCVKIQRVAPVRTEGTPDSYHSEKCRGLGIVPSVGED